MKKIFVIFTALICTLPSMAGELFSKTTKDLLKEDGVELKKDDYYVRTHTDSKNRTVTAVYVPDDIYNKISTKTELEANKEKNNIVFIKQSDDEDDPFYPDDDDSEDETAKKSKKKKTDSKAKAVFGNIEIPDPLFRAMSSKNVNPEALCKSKPGLINDKGDYDEDCAYINPYFGICDTHVYNIGGPENPTNSDDIEKMQQVIAVKTTVLSQQMYKQYEYLAATLRRLKTQLEKSVLNAELEMLGANSDKSSNSVYGKNSNYSECSTGDQNSSLWCLRQNYSALLNQVNNGTCGRDEKKQIAKDLKLIKSWLNLGDDDCFDESKISSRDKCRECLNNVYQVDLIKLQRDIEDSEYKRKMLYH